MSRATLILFDISILLLSIATIMSALIVRRVLKIIKSVLNNQMELIEIVQKLLKKEVVSK